MLCWYTLLFAKENIEVYFEENTVRSQDDIDYFSCDLCGSVEMEKKRGNPPGILKNLPGWGTFSRVVDSTVDYSLQSLRSSATSAIRVGLCNEF